MPKTVNTSEVDSFHRDLMAAALERLSPHGAGLDPAEVVAREIRGDRERIWTRLRDAMSDNCHPCIHAVIFGWWGPPLLKDLNATSHCRTCHRSWRGTKQAHCVVEGCHEQFSSAEAASKHWVNDRHIHPSNVRGRDGEPRFCQSEQDSPFGVVWTLCRHREAS